MPVTINRPAPDTPDPAERISCSECGIKLALKGGRELSGMCSVCLGAKKKDDDGPFGNLFGG